MVATLNGRRLFLLTQKHVVFRAARSTQAAAIEARRSMSERFPAVRTAGNPQCLSGVQVKYLPAHRNCGSSTLSTT
jgi:hypothetical protein